MSVIDELVEMLEKAGVKSEYVRANSDAYFEHLSAGLGGIGLREWYFDWLEDGDLNVIFEPPPLDKESLRQMQHLEKAGLLYRPEEVILKEREDARRKGHPMDDYSALRITEKGKILYENHAREFGKLLDGVEGIDQLGTTEK